MGWLTGWDYRRKHTINAATGAGTNYQIKVEVYYGDVGGRGSWTTKQTLPSVQGDPGGAVYNDKLYVIGGYGVGGAADRLDNCREYDPATNQWTEKTAMPTARVMPAACEYNGKIYVFGGQGGSGANLEVYDPVGNSWETKTDCPTAFGGGGAIEHNGKIYLIGRTVTWEYNPSGDSWVQKTSQPAAAQRTWAVWGKATVGGKTRIYQLGGHQEGVGGTNTVYYYTIEDNAWTGPETAAPYSVYGLARENPVVGGMIYYGFGLGTGGIFGFHRRMFKYNPQNDTWSEELLSGEYVRDGHVCGVIGNKIYFAAGRDNFGALDVNEEFDLNITEGAEKVKVAGACETDFGDIRFTESDGSTELDYWMEYKFDGEYAFFWVEVADDLSSSAVDIYMYYAKSGASTTSNVTNTFIRIIDAGQPVKLALSFDDGRGAVAQDESGGAHWCDMSGGFTFVDGKWGKCINVDGVDGMGSIAHHTDLDMNVPFSISFWIYPNTNEQGAVVHKLYTSGYMAWYYNDLMHFYWNAGIRSFYGISTGVWTKVDLVWDGSYSYVYINKVERDKDPQASGPNANAYAVEIGRYSNVYLNCKIDEVMMMHHPLIQAEIDDLYDHYGMCSRHYAGRVLVRSRVSPEPVQGDWDPQEIGLIPRRKLIGVGK